MPALCEYKTVQPPNLVYGESVVLTALVQLKAKQAKCDLNLRNEAKGETIDMRAPGKPEAALPAQLKSRSKR